MVKSIKKYLSEIKWWTKYRKIAAEAKRYGDDYIVLMGTPLHGNLGDHAITLATYQVFNHIDSSLPILEISGERIRTQEHVKKFREIIKDKTIFINGGGFLGSLWMYEEKMVRNIVSTYPDNRIIILPQTLYFEDSEFGESVKEKSIEIYNSHPNLCLCTRETQSYELAKELLPNVQVMLIPDMVTYMSYQAEKTEKSGVLLCLRSDSERILNDNDWEFLNNILVRYMGASNINHTDTVVNYKIKKEEREREIYKKLEEFSASKLVITDRLHGMILAAIACTPCIALGNCNYKVKGVYNWIKNNKYVVYVETMEQMEEQIEHLIHMDSVKYDNQQILNNYNELLKLMKEAI